MRVPHYGTDASAAKLRDFCGIRSRATWQVRHQRSRNLAIRASEVAQLGSARHQKSRNLAPGALRAVVWDRGGNGPSRRAEVEGAPAGREPRRAGMCWRRRGTLLLCGSALGGAAPAPLPCLRLCGGPLPEGPPRGWEPPHDARGARRASPRPALRGPAARGAPRTSRGIISLAPPHDGPLPGCASFAASEVAEPGRPGIRGRASWQYGHQRSRSLAAPGIRSRATCHRTRCPNA
jgi:hypothetical protein